MKKKNLVLVGGGHSHALLMTQMAKELRMWQDVALTVISPSRISAYSGMMTGAIAGLYSLEEIHYDVKKLAENVGATFVEDFCVGIDLPSRVVHLASKDNRAYDLLSLNVGSVPRPLPFSTGVKPIGSFFERLSAIEVAGGVTQNIDVIGGGTSGCEVAMSLAGKALRQGLSWKICLFESSNSILPGQAPMLKSRVQEQLRKYKIDVYLGNPFKATVGRTVVNCTPARAPEWLAQTGLKTDEQGYVIHDSSLLTSDPSVFACGDMAINPQEPTVRAGVYAVRQAPILKKNLRANLNSESYAQFHPQRNFLSLMVDGEGGAFGSKGSMYLGHSPFFLWIKDRIDRKFMNKISSS